VRDDVYLNLFHGRAEPNEPMEGWGFEGPVLGPFLYVHITYASVVHVSTDGEGFDLPFAYDCLAYDGKFYGDFSIISEERATTELRTRIEPIDVTRSILRAAGA
jgi:hypothetical protein